MLLSHHLLAQEDLWLSLVDDWSANSTRGDLARERGMARSSRKMLEQLCTIPSPFFEQLPGMYAIKECRDGHTAEGTLCKPAALFAASTKNALQRYHVMRVPTDDNDDPVMPVGREQQLGAYKLVCQAHILPAEPDFSETIGAVLLAAIVGCSVQPAVGIRYSSDANFNGPTL